MALSSEGRSASFINDSSPLANTIVCFSMNQNKQTHELQTFLNLNAFWRIIATVGLTSNFLGTSCSKSIHFGIHATSRRCQHELTLTSITDDMCLGQKVDCSVHWVLTTFQVAGKEMIHSDCPQVSIKQKRFHGDQLSVLQTC